VPAWATPAIACSAPSSSPGSEHHPVGARRDAERAAERARELRAVDEAAGGGHLLDRRARRWPGARRARSTRRRSISFAGVVPTVAAQRRCSVRTDSPAWRASRGTSRPRRCRGPRRWPAPADRRRSGPGARRSTATGSPAGARTAPAATPTRVGDRAAVVVLDHRQRHVDAGGDPGRGPQPPVAHEDRLAIDGERRAGTPPGDRTRPSGSPPGARAAARRRPARTRPSTPSRAARPPAPPAPATPSAGGRRSPRARRARRRRPPARCRARWRARSRGRPWRRPGRSTRRSCRRPGWPRPSR
jgi:hypothetical protein